uniref:DUF4937 domain-containing protein n=1 Tax=Heterorhabditis bacteriophora TaxID=37862 RepID=A0A1I7WQR9_HETBA
MRKCPELTQEHKDGMFHLAEYSWDATGEKYNFYESSKISLLIIWNLGDFQ